MAVPEFAPMAGWTGSTTPEPAPGIPLDVASAIGKLTRALLAAGQDELHEAAELAMRGALDLKSLVGDPVPPIVPPTRSLGVLAADLGAVAAALDALSNGDPILRGMADDARNCGADVKHWNETLGGAVDVRL